jgi:hypothetical protein
MAEYFPQAVVLIADLIATDGFLLQPPLAWTATAEQINAESGSTITGRYIESTGEAAGQPLPKRQDTFLHGTSGRTGRDFTAVTGTWQDDWVSPQYDSYGLLFPDSTPGASFEVVSYGTTPRIEAAEIILRRGLPPAGSSSAHTPQNNYAYLHLAYQSDSGRDYRLAFEYGQPIRLDYSEDGGTTWQPVAIARALGSVERYLAAHNNEIRINVRPYQERGVLVVEIGDGSYLRHKPTDVTLDSDQTILDVLPEPGNLRLLGQNGWVTLEYYPHRYQQVTIRKGSRDFGTPLANLGNAVVTTGALADYDADQTVSYGIDSADGQNVGWSVTASLPDAGDSLGSAEPPRLTEGTLLLPSMWTFDGSDLGLLPDIGVQVLKTMRVEEVQTWDDATRTLSTSMLVSNNNYLLEYVGAFGHRAIQILASNDNTTFVPRFQGIAGCGERGLHLFRQDPARLFGVPCSDLRFKMAVSLGEEMLFDGWCLFSAVRFLCERGNIHPGLYLQTIPDWPYGPTDASCPYPVLSKGTGRSANYRFTPDQLVWNALQLLAQDTGSLEDLAQDPRYSGGLTMSLPYYMGWDMRDIPLYGRPQFRFEPFDPANLLPKILYSTNDPTGLAQIEEIEVYNSVDQMRTELAFEGMDADALERITTYRAQPPDVLATVGFRRPWQERSARYGSAAALAARTETAAAQASLPTQTVHLRVPFQPGIFAGDRVLVLDAGALGGVGDFYITELRNVYGLTDLSGRSGTQECYSLLTARALTNTPLA